MQNSDAPKIAKLPLLAAVIALVGLADAIYLTVKHLSGDGVQCTIVHGCEQVLNSDYAKFAGIPLAFIGVAAYFTVFSLATLAAFGNRQAWNFLSIMVGMMAIFTGWLLYLQGFVIEAFCQFCLLSAGVTFTLLGIVIVSRYFFKRLA
ncbi:MAG: vitamin K epoxide reductase family protein [Pyrinomonadaceae bacterium]